jgi:hypothetical protein
MSDADATFDIVVYVLVAILAAFVVWVVLL